MLRLGAAAAATGTEVALEDVWRECVEELLCSEAGEGVSWWS